MNLHVQQQGGNTAVALTASPLDRPSHHQQILTFAQVSAAYPAWTVPSLRNLRFKAKERHSTKGVIAGNGLIEAGAFIVIGTRMLIDVAKFFAWVETQNEAPK